MYPHRLFMGMFGVFPTLNICEHLIDILSGTFLSNWPLLLCNMKAFMHLKCTDCCLAEREKATCLNLSRVCCWIRLKVILEVWFWDRLWLWLMGYQFIHGRVQQADTLEFGIIAIAIAGRAFPAWLTHYSSTWVPLSCGSCSLLTSLGFCSIAPKSHHQCWK